LPGAIGLDGIAQRLDATADRLDSKIDTGSQLAFDFSPEYIDASVDNLIDIYGEDAVRRLYGALQRRFTPAAEPALAQPIPRSSGRWRSRSAGAASEGRMSRHAEFKTFTAALRRKLLLPSAPRRGDVVLPNARHATRCGRPAPRSANA
jgi:hypothetical protein